MKKLLLMILSVLLLTACSSEPKDPSLVFTTKGLPKAEAEQSLVISQIDLRDSDQDTLLLDITYADTEAAPTLEEQLTYLQLVELPRGEEIIPSRLVLRLRETGLGFRPQEVVAIQHPLVRQVSFTTFDGEPVVTVDFHNQIDLQPSVDALRITPCPSWTCRDPNQMHLFKQPPLVVTSAEEAALYLPEPIATPTYLPGGQTFRGFRIDEAMGRVIGSFITEAGLTEIFQEWRPAAYSDVTPYPKPDGLSPDLTIQHSRNQSGDDVWLIEKRYGDLYLYVSSTLPLEEVIAIAEGLQ